MSARRVRIVDLANGTVVAEAAEVADSFWARGLGLLGRSPLRQGQALVIVPCGSVHSIGMTYPIDVLHVGRDGRVLKVLEDFRPHRFAPLVWGSRLAVELPAGTAERLGIKRGNAIELQDLPRQTV